MRHRRDDRAIIEWSRASEDLRLSGYGFSLRSPRCVYMSYLDHDHRKREDIRTLGESHSVL